MDFDQLSSILAERLASRQATVATAESCTGGLVAHIITNRPGSSAYYLGGVVAYSNELKISILGVSPDLLATKGAVSAETVEAMALGVRRLTGATYGLATSGIAGPGGGTADKPVGLVYLGLAGPRGVVSSRQLFMGDRIGIKHQATEAVLRLLLAEL
ncbi:MAG: CinA family protein [Firmicutes bacterium]|nr:CinA family protein [Bacillota bacterium]